MSRRLDGEQVVLIDDVYTTGATAQSAAYTLELAGVTVETILVIGRRINPLLLQQLGHPHPHWDGHEQGSDFSC